jgi:signal peptidase
MNQTVKKVYNCVTSVLVALVVVLAIALVGVRLVGIQTYTVLSGSMEPTYHTGSLLYVKSVDVADLEVGDPITFLLDEDTVATHRIIEIIPDEEDSSVIRFRTQGDANENPDGSLVHYKNVIGTPIFSIPYLGYFASAVQSPPGLYIAIGTAGLLILLVFLPDVFSDDKKGKREASDKSGDIVKG